MRLSRLPTPVEPQGLVGLFYSINGQLYVHAEARGAVPRIAGYQTSDLSHFDYYYALFPHAAEDYDFYPRGRVFYQESRQRFIIYCDPYLRHARDMREEITRTFHLQRQRVVWRGNEQYRCGQYAQVFTKGN